MAKLVTPIGRFAYGQIIEPRINPNNGKPEFVAALELEETEATPILEQIEAALVDARAKDPTFPAEGIHLPYKPAAIKNLNGEYEPKPGYLVFRFKRNAVYRDRNTGEERRNPGPVIWDSRGSICKPASVGLGSRIRVIYSVFVYGTKTGGRALPSKGVQVQVDGVQIVELAESSFTPEPVAGGWVAEQDLGVSELESLLNAP